MKFSSLSTSKKTNSLLIAGIFCALASLGVYGYLFHAVKTSTEHTASLQAEVGALETQEAEVDKLKKNFAATKEQQDTLSSYFIDMNNPVPFFETIEAYGKNVGVKAVFDTVTIKKAPNELDASVTVSGSFSGIYQFLQMLEVAPYEFSITSMTIQSTVPAGLEPIGKGPHTSGWEATIQLAVKSITGTQ